MTRSKPIKCPFDEHDCFSDDCTKMVCESERAYHKQVREFAEHRAKPTVKNTRSLVENRRVTEKILAEHRARLPEHVVRDLAQKKAKDLAEDKRAAARIFAGHMVRHAEQMARHAEKKPEDLAQKNAKALAEKRARELAEFYAGFGVVVPDPKSEP